MISDIYYTVAIIETAPTADFDYLGPEMPNRKCTNIHKYLSMRYVTITIHHDQS